MKFFQIAFLALFLPLCCMAQEGLDENREEQDEKVYEAIQKEIEHYTITLDLEDWQVFYMDSVLNYNYEQMFNEFKRLSKTKVSNRDLYTSVNDKWSEASYQAFRKFLTPEQWAKYEKSGASRNKKARDKRMQKAK